MGRNSLDPEATQGTTEFDAEVIERIEEMESSDYAFPEPFGHRDRILSGSLIAAMAAWIVLSYLL